MGYFILSFLVFFSAYVVNMLYTSVFYHRGLTHGAVKLGKKTRRFVIRTGNWVTGIDPKTWICMHRIHHKFADTSQDPHSPRVSGVLPILFIQLRSYGETMSALLEKKHSHTAMVRDLEFPVNWLNRKGLWFLPHLLHTLFAISLALAFHAPLLAFCYWFGMMSHPFQGWLVNAFGHQYGYRNFATRDGSTNHLLVAWLVMGEGFQNNHHYRPRSARFAVKWWEIDSGYWLCLLARRVGLIEFGDPVKASRPRKAA